MGSVDWKSSERRIGALDILDGSFEILRENWSVLLPLHLLGSLPFISLLLIFVNDMAFSAHAIHDCAFYSLLLSVLFVWKNVISSLFCRRAMSILCGGEAFGGIFSFRKIFAILAVQGIIQPIGLFVRAISLVLFFTTPWTSVFFNSVTIYAGTEDSLSSVLKKSFRSLGFDSWLNNVLHLCFWALGFMLFLNVYIFMFILPWVLKNFFGVETIFSLSSPAFFFNTTLFSLAIAIVLLAIDLLIKTCYIIWTFHIESESKGYDLLYSLKKIAARAKNNIPVAALIALCFAPFSLCSQETSADAINGARLAPERIKDAANQVFLEKEFAWRMGLVESDEERSFISRTLESFFRKIESWLRSLSDFLGSLFPAKDRNWNGYNLPEVFSDGRFWGALAFLVLGIAALIVIRKMRLKKHDCNLRIASVAKSVASQIEDMTALDLDESGWSSMASDFLASGDLSRAVRAFFMASLSCMFSRNAIVFSKSKTNLEYRREFARRMKGAEELHSLFRSSVALFESVCYGGRTPVPEDIELMKRNHEALRRGLQQ